MHKLKSLTLLQCIAILNYFQTLELKHNSKLKIWLIPQHQHYLQSWSWSRTHTQHQWSPRHFLRSLAASTKYPVWGPLSWCSAAQGWCCCWPVSSPAVRSLCTGWQRTEWGSPRCASCSGWRTAWWSSDWGETFCPVQSELRDRI